MEEKVYESYSWGVLCEIVIIHEKNYVYMAFLFM